MSAVENRIYEFGPFQLDTEERSLVCDGCLVPLTPKAFELLLVLVRKSGHVIGKDELMKAVWPDSFVEDGNLTQHIFAIRKALGESQGESLFIETVARRGYRFSAKVNESVKTGALSEEQAQTSRDLATDVNQRKQRWRIAAVTGLVGATILIATFIVRPHFSQPGEAIESIAVLPFVNVKGDPDVEYLSDGLTESTVNSLSQLTTLRVVPTSTMFRYKGKSIDPQSVARELGVRAVLTGEITKQADSLIIHVELIDAQRDAHFWGEQYNRKFVDIPSLPDDISKEISVKLRLRLAGDQQRLIKSRAHNGEAYQLYLKGRYFWNKRTEEGVRKAIDYLQQAIDSDPLYALAYAGLADCYIVLGAPLNAVPPKEAFSKAKAAATKALEIDDTLAEAHATLGAVKQRFEWDREGAAQEFRRAIELNPTYATAHQWYAINFEINGESDAATAETRRALEIDPLSLIINARLGYCYYFSRQYDLAIEQYKKTIELDPNFAIAHSRLGWAYIQQGKNGEAVEELLRAGILSGTSTQTVAALRQAFVRSGLRGYWQKELELELAKSKLQYVSAYEIALLYARVGAKAQAFDWLDRAYEERSSALVYLKVEPGFDNLRQDSRFAEMLRRIHLA